MYKVIFCIVSVEQKAKVGHQVQFWGSVFITNKSHYNRRQFHQITNMQIQLSFPLAPIFLVLQDLIPEDFVFILKDWF